MDEVLRDLYRRGGLRAFDRPADVVAELEHRLGGAALPGLDALKQHIVRFRKGLDSW